MLKFSRPTLVTITAPTCSGKNYLRDHLEKDFGWTRIVSTTTRAARKGEVDGEDYRFISIEESKDLEARGLFAELISFRGVRYGVTKAEMAMKIRAQVAPMVILEPKGLEIYKTMCRENNWDVFSIYIHTPEDVRLKRLTERTCVEIQAAAVENYTNGGADSLRTRGDTFFAIEKIIKTHTDRIQSIVGEERLWSNQNNWNAIVPGDNLVKALEMVQQGVKWKNRQNETPTPYTHVV